MKSVRILSCERWAVNDERWTMSRDVACSVRGFHSRQSRQSRKGLEQYFVTRSIGYAIRWNWGRDLQSPSMLSGHRPLYSKTANNIFAVTERHVFLFWFLCLVLFVRAWDYNSCVLFGRCTQTSLLLAQSQISASVRGDVLEMARCGILKQVIRLRSSKTSYIFEWGMVRMTFVYSPLIAHRSSLIACHWKFFTKLNFHINPAVKSKVPSWKIFISQLEN